MYIYRYNLLTFKTVCKFYYYCCLPSYDGLEKAVFKPLIKLSCIQKKKVFIQSHGVVLFEILVGVKKIIIVVSSAVNIGGFM